MDLTSMTTHQLVAAMLHASPEIARALDAHLAARGRLAADVRRGLAADEFELHYQPIRDMETASITGFEALLRWRHPDRGLLAAGHFLHDVERCGVMVDIGEFVLAEGCAQLAEWQATLGDDAPSVSLNVSARQLAETDFADRVAHHVEAAGADPSGLCLELTETCALEHEQHELGQLDAVRRHGIRIALDDFGTGYSSLHHVLRIDADVIKVDRSFTSQLGIDDRATVIVRAAIEMAGAFDTTVVAEGVTTIEQYRMLREMGCDATQGFLIAPAVPAAEADAMIRSHCTTHVRRPAGVDRLAAVQRARTQLTAVDPDYEPSAEEIAALAGELPSFVRSVAALLSAGAERSADLDVALAGRDHDRFEL